MSVGLSVKRMTGESWRDCVIRYASKYGLQAECLAVFNGELSSGTEEGAAAWCALYEYDALGLAVIE